MQKRLSKKQKHNRFFCRFAKNAKQNFEDWNGLGELCYSDMRPYFSLSRFPQGNWHTVHEKKIDHKLNDYCEFSVWIYKKEKIERLLELEYMGDA